MMTLGAIDPARTRWQFLFPEGLRESYRRSNGDKSVMLYTPALCRSIVARFWEYVAASEAFGFPAQPLPVQLQHVGIKSEATTPHDSRRVAGIHALHYHGGELGEGVPRGVWGLFEWTPEGQTLVESGQFPTISPTTGVMTLSDGKRLQAPTLLEASLVDVPFFEGIGTAADFLPLDTFPYTGRRPVSESTRSTTRRIVHNDATMISRGAIDRSEVMENGEVEVSAQLTPELLKALGESETMRAMCRAMCREYMESDDFVTMMESRGMVKREAIAIPTVGEVETAAEDAAVLESRRKAGVDFEAIENTRLNAEVADLVKSGKLLAANASRFIARRKAGDDVSELVGDYTGWKTATGTPGRNAEPVTRSAARSVNAGEVLQRIQTEGARVGRGPSENLKLYMAELETLRTQGVTVVEA